MALFLPDWPTDEKLLVKNMPYQGSTDCCLNGKFQKKKNNTNPLWL